MNTRAVAGAVAGVVVSLTAVLTLNACRPAGALNDDLPTGKNIVVTAKHHTGLTGPDSYELCVRDTGAAHAREVCRDVKKDVYDRNAVGRRYQP